MELGPNQEKWLRALESGKFLQGRHVLHDKRTNSFCCLGVASYIFRDERFETQEGDRCIYYDGEDVDAPGYVVDALALYNEGGQTLDGLNSLAMMNDYIMTFKEIAETVRKNPKNFFKEPK